MSPFEVGSSVSVTSYHRMPVEGPEGELHSHPYRLDVVVGRGELDHRGMVCDLDALNEALRSIARKLDGADLESIRPPEAEAVTVEVFARWVHQALAPALVQEGAETLGVRVWESNDAFGGYAGPVGETRP